MKQVALITGGARGIGLGISTELAKAKYNLIICGRKAESEVESVLEQLRTYGGKISYCVCDVSEASQRRSLLSKIEAEFGTLNFLINNAGVAPLERKDLLDASEESYDRVMSINLKGPYFLTQELAKYMISKKGADDTFEGAVVNITSISSTTASINRGEYCISKAGMSMATKLWAFRLAEYDIPVYEIRPGLTLTDMVSAVKPKYDQMIADGLTLEKRWGLPEDIGKAVVTLVQGNIPYATGQVLTMDGGLSLERL